MTASASRPMRRGMTVYRSATRVHKVTEQSFVVYADPIPIHAARVYQRGSHGAWTVEFYTTLDPRKYVYDQRDTALQAAGELVGRKAGQEWKERFTGLQRYAMGQQECPRLMGPGAGVCGQSPEPGSVWCSWHPKGKDLK